MSTLDLEAFRYVNVISDKQVPGTNFTGTVQFNYMNPSEQAISNLKDSYFVFVAEAVGAEAVTLNTSMSVPNNISHNHGLVQAPGAALFNGGQFMVNDNLISNINSFSVDMVHSKFMNESYQQQKESSNPLYTHDNTVSMQTVVATGVTPADAGVTTAQLFNSVRHLSDYFLKGRKVNAQVIRMHVGGTKFSSESDNEIITPYELAMVIPFPFFDAVSADDDAFMLGNTKLSVSLQINPSYARDLFTQTYAVTAANYNVTMFEWVIPCYKAPSIPASLTLSRRFYDKWTTRATMNSTQYQYQVPATTQRVVISFMTKLNTSLLNQVANNGYDIIAGRNPYLPVRVSSVSGFYININGRNFPSNPYNFPPSPIAPGTGVGRNDWLRAYEDYKRYSQSHVTGEENIIKSFKEYMNCPVFVAQTLASVNSVGTTTLTVYTNGNSSVNTYDLCISCEYPKELAIEYDDGGVPVSTSVALI